MISSQICSTNGWWYSASPYTLGISYINEKAFFRDKKLVFYDYAYFKLTYKQNKVGGSQNKVWYICFDLVYIFSFFKTIRFSMNNPSNQLFHEQNGWIMQ